jgi:hypothetical protein
MQAVVTGALSEMASEAIEIGALPQAVRRLHFGEESITARGRFTVRRGRRWLARLAAWALRLPPAGRDVAFALRVDRTSDRETWRRSFQGTMVAGQFHITGSSSTERVGPIEMTNAVSVERAQPGSGMLRMRSRHAALAVGPFRVALPPFLAPRIASRTWMRPGEAQVRACVVVIVPVCGLVFAYRGYIEEV